MDDPERKDLPWTAPIFACMSEWRPEEPVTLKEFFKRLKQNYLRLKPSQDEELATIYAAYVVLSPIAACIFLQANGIDDVGRLAQMVYDFAKQWRECALEHEVYDTTIRRRHLKDIEEKPFQTIFMADSAAAFLLKLVEQIGGLAPSQHTNTNMSIRAHFHSTREAFLQRYPSKGKILAGMVAARDALAFCAARFRKNDMGTIYHGLKEWKECVEEHQVPETMSKEHDDDGTWTAIAFAYQTATWLTSLVADMRHTQGTPGEGPNSGFPITDPALHEKREDPEEQADDNEEEEAEKKGKNKKKKNKKKKKKKQASATRMPIASEVRPEDALADGFEDPATQKVNIVYDDDLAPSNNDPALTESTVIATCIPPLPLTDKGVGHSPDGHSIWYTTSASKQLYYANKGWPKPVPKFPVNYVVKESGDGVGMGVFATRDIKRFEPIIVERPFFVTPSRSQLLTRESLASYQNLTAGQVIQLEMRLAENTYSRIIDKLMTPEVRKEFMSLANSHQHDGSGPILGIIRTNSFKSTFARVPSVARIDQDYGYGYGAVGKISSRFNHSCCPNAMNFGFDPVTFTMRFAAVRDIKAGSEIYVSYIDSFLPKAERQKQLLPYDFECACHGCANATPESEKLRATSSKMIEDWLQQAQSDWLQRPVLRESVLKPLVDMREQLEKNGLDVPNAGYMTLLMVLLMGYQKAGIRNKAKEIDDLLASRQRDWKRVAEWQQGK